MRRILSFIRRPFRRKPRVVYVVCPVCQRQAINLDGGDSLAQQAVQAGFRLEAHRGALIDRDPTLAVVLKPIEANFVGSMRDLAGRTHWPPTEGEVKNRNE